VTGKDDRMIVVRKDVLDFLLKSDSSFGDYRTAERKRK